MNGGFMATETVWMLGASRVGVSGGGQLSGLTQGNGAHLVGRTLTLAGPDWQQTHLTDDDTTFDDNDTSQRLAGTQQIDGVTYAGGTVVEAEYRLILRDAATGQQWEVFGYNLVNSNPTFATIEGLAFRGGVGQFPPIGRPLTVISATEGPDRTLAYPQLASPPCFTPGALILTPDGERPVEALRVGDLVSTLDAGDQPLVWTGYLTVPAAQVAACPAFRPVRIGRGALGGGLPRRDLIVSRQHRMLMGGARAELLFGAPEVLVAARHLAGRLDGVSLLDGLADVTYHHIMFVRHHVIWAEGAATESFSPGDLALLPEATLAEVSLARTGQRRPAPARRALAAWEAALLIA